jgi:hypothetical protein
MTIATTPSQALEQYRAAHSQWQRLLTTRSEAQSELKGLLAASEEPADISERVSQLREHLEVLDWQINCAAREGVYAQRIALEACTGDALNVFMATQGPALASALAPFLNSPGGMEVAARMMRSALAHQLQAARPEVGEDYRELLSETGLTPVAEMLKDCQQGYTPAQHLRYQHRLSRFEAQQGGASWL